MTSSLGSNLSNSPLTSTNFQSDIEPSYASDTNEIAPLGVIPINTFTVFLFLYAEKVQAWTNRKRVSQLEIQWHQLLLEYWDTPS